VTELGAFSSDDAVATMWAQARGDLQDAEAYWLSTVRANNASPRSRFRPVSVVTSTMVAAGRASDGWRGLERQTNTHLDDGVIVIDSDPSRNDWRMILRIPADGA
jgi:hypothetical protein